MITGESMPDKNDPKYRERYEREVEAGRKFAEKVGINWLIAKLQLWANDHRIGFLIISFGIVIALFGINIFNMVRAYQTGNRHRGTAVEMVDSTLQHRRLNKR